MINSNDVVEPFYDYEFKPRLDRVNTQEFNLNLKLLVFPKAILGRFIFHKEIVEKAIYAFIESLDASGYDVAIGDGERYVTGLQVEQETKEDEKAVSASSDSGSSSGDEHGVEVQESSEHRLVETSETKE
jgi:hypothetical protein